MSGARKKYYENLTPEDIGEAFVEMETKGKFVFDDNLPVRPLFTWEIECPITNQWQGLIERGGTIAISGKEKSRKSTLAGMFTSAYLSRQFNNLNYTHPEPQTQWFQQQQRGFQRIRTYIDYMAPALYFDTEQPDSDFKRSQSAIILNAGLNYTPSNYEARCLSRFSDAGTKFTMVLSKIKEVGDRYGQVGLVVLDQVVDLVESPMEVQQAKDFYGEIGRFKALYNFDLIIVIHQNRGNNQTNGSMGVETNKKCSYLIQLLKGDELSNKNMIDPYNQQDDSEIHTKAITEVKRLGESFKTFEFNFVKDPKTGRLLPSFIDQKYGTYNYGQGYNPYNQFQ